ncbi:MAG TPA: GIY-YIG nuclease family protein [Alphaproteobacteria bacterium]|nr:GIY-YIG nuclease family protein [Alphaproteobacteria bacterium]
MAKPGYVYIMTNRRNGTLYVGVTNDLARRTWQHRNGVVPGFTARYRLKRLVWFEAHDEIAEAIRQERVMKNWQRAWKIRRIEERNPEWRDLYDEIAAP